MLEGYVKILHSKTATVTDRSGIDGFVLNPIDRNPDLIMLAPPVTANTVEKAREIAIKLGKMAHGVTTNRSGIFIRVHHDDQAEAKADINPLLATAVGEELFHCRKADGIVFHAVGVPFTMPDDKLVNALAQQPRDLEQPEWRCIPFAVSDKGVWGKKTMVVKALSLPYESTVRIKYAGRV